MADRSYIDDNTAEREKLAAFVATLSDEDMARTIDGGWTVAATLAHLAVLDRLWLQKFEEWDRNGKVVVPGVGATVDGTFIHMNVGLTPWFESMSPSEARIEVVAAMEAIDKRLETVSDTVVDQILAERPRTIRRAVHRREHRADIEKALGRLTAVIE
jgi:uncharacterized damage-inducible protein DinB